MVCSETGESWGNFCVTVQRSFASNRQENSAHRNRNPTEKILNFNSVGVAIQFFKAKIFYGKMVKNLREIRFENDPIKNHLPKLLWSRHPELLALLLPSIILPLNYFALIFSTASKDDWNFESQKPLQTEQVFLAHRMRSGSPGGLASGLPLSQWGYFPTFTGERISRTGRFLIQSPS